MTIRKIDAGYLLKSSAANEVEFGMDRRGATAIDIIQNTLNKKTLAIFFPETKRVDPYLTTQLKAKQQLILNRFQEFLQEPRRSKLITDTYNERMNVYRTAQFDGSHLTFPGLATGIELKEHQKNAVWRILHDGKAFIAHPGRLGHRLPRLLLLVGRASLGCTIRYLIWII